VAKAPNLDASLCQTPEYPPQARREEATGITKLHFEIDEHGKVKSSRVVRSSGPTRAHKVLDTAALNALSLCNFQPGIDENGKPVGGSTELEYKWNLMQP
jgi:protein TonB